MGNCMRRGSANMVWAGDDEEDGEDWGRRQGRREMDESCGGGDESGGHGGEEVEKQRLLGDDHDEMGGGGGGSVSSSNKSTREVKIKITRKELEELVGRADVQGLSVEQILATLINGSGYPHGNYHHQQHHLRSWRPVLHSIPEVN
ncbi:hypothetical protein ACOSP7_012918 [Xanthoceras sorbifolium]